MRSIILIVAFIMSTPTLAHTLRFDKYAYKTRSGDSLSSVLFRVGFGKSNDQLTRLYGKDGMIEVIKDLNPSYKNLDNLSAGMRLTLLVPRGVRVPPGFEPIIERQWSGGTLHNLIYERQILSEGSSLSQLLFRRGIGSKTSPFKLYGADGFVSRHQSLNPRIKDWDGLRPGQVVLLNVPDGTEVKNVAAAPLTLSAKLYEGNVSPTHAETPKLAPPNPTPPPLTESQKKVIAAPKDAKLEEIVALPQEELSKVDRQLLKQKLSDDTIAKLDAQAIAKIPVEVKSEKAWEFSIFDSFKPGMDQFLTGVGSTTASGYFGLRVANSLALQDPLLKNVRIFGLLIEIRGSVLDGLRLYYDIFPESKASIDGEVQRLSLQRVLAAFAFAIDPGFLVDSIHLTPRLGSYSVDARLPYLSSLTESAAVNAPPRPIENRDISIGNALAAGIEVDVEWSSLFYILRAWYAQDFSGLGRSKSGVTSQRLGFDAFLKGGGFTLFGSRLSLAYLAFLAHEKLSLNSEEDSETFALDLTVPYAGLGISTSW